MHSYTSLGPWIKQRRKALDLTQDDLSRRIGYALSTVRKIESGVLRPSREVAERMARCLEIEPAEWQMFIQLARTPIDEAPVSQRSPAANAAAGAAAPAPLPRRALLPAPPGPLIGRDHEVAALRERLREDTVRLLTLLGPPGIGKTRLAIQVAAGLTGAFADGVRFVSLASLADPALVLPAIAEAFAIEDQPNQTLQEGLIAGIGGRQVLLVLDNLEHVLAAAPEIAALLTGCPRLKVLATSRAILRLRGEQQVTVAPLETPPAQAAEGIERYPAVALFVACARLVAPDFAITAENAAAVASICARLDGLPLAIELIAARVKVMSPQTLASRLDSVSSWLTGREADRPARQQTLRAAIDWSYQLLTPEERRIFLRLGVFAGGCTLEAVESVCTTSAAEAVDVAEHLAALLDKSMIQHQAQPDEEPRFTMLAMLREYALEQLAAAGELAATERRYADYFTSYAEQAEAEFKGPHEPRWMDRLTLEHDNLRAVIGRSIESGDPRAALRIGGAIWRFWMMRSFIGEGRRWLETALALPAQVEPALRAKALHAAASLALLQSDHQQAQPFYEESLALRRELNDNAGIASSLTNLSVVALHRADFPRAAALLEEGLGHYRVLGDRRGIAAALTNLGLLAQDMGDYALARSHYQEAMAIQRDLNNQMSLANVLALLGTVAQEQGDYAAAKPFFTEALQIQRAIGDQQSITTPLDGLALVALAEGDLATARHYWVELLNHAVAMEQQRFIAVALEGFARLTGAEGKPAIAANLWGAAEAIHEAIGVPVAPSTQVLHAQDQRQARTLIDDAAWEAAWQAGRALSVEQAVAAALAS